MKIFFYLSILVFSLYSPVNHADDVFTIKNLGLELANDIAMATVLACRKQGYQVSAVVVDRNGLVRAALRDDLAASFTLQIAEEKANTVIMSGMDSGAFVKARQDIRPELNHINGLIMMEGGIAINAAGYRLGAVGVSGAPGGDKDEACAKKGVEKYLERLEFID